MWRPRHWAVWIDPGTNTWLLFRQNARQNVFNWVLCSHFSQFQTDLVHILGRNRYSQLKFTIAVWLNVWKLSLTPTVFLSMVHCSNIFGQSDLFAAIDFNSDDDWAFPGLFPKWAFRMKFFFKRLQIFRLPFNFQRARNKLCLWRCVVKFNESISLWWCIHNSWCWCWFWLEILPCALFVQNKFLSFWRRFFLMIKFSFSNKPWSQMYPFESKQLVDSFFLWIDVREQP